MTPDLKPSAHTTSRQDETWEPIRFQLRGGRLIARGPDRRRRPLADLPLDSPACVPFLKWAGGKQWLAPAVKQLAPAKFGRFYEAFVGAGAMGFALSPERRTLTDANDELTQTYLALRDDVDGVVAGLGELRHAPTTFERVRAQAPESATARAVRMIYLNRTAFNGIYRVNREGQFNVPFGRLKNPTICDEPRLRACSEALQAASIRCADFATALSRARSGDFAYLDPPYITGHMNNGFVKWNAKIFDWEDQRRLANTARSLIDRGVSVLVSNADHPAVTALYPGFHYYRVERMSRIGGAGATRGWVSEALLSSYPLLGIASVKAHEAS